MFKDTEIINPIKYPGWDDMVLSSQYYSFFHSSSWAQVLYESYGYMPHYFTLIDNSRLASLIPCMEVNSFLTGKRGVSLPFSDYCEPIIAKDTEFQDIFDSLITYGKKTGWKYIEIRDGRIFPQDISPSSYYYGHTLSLQQGEEGIFSGLRESTRRNIKKAVKEGVKVDISNSLKSISEFYKLNCMTRKQHGLPPQPYNFFKKIYEHVLAKNLGFVALASYKETVIAGAVYFYFGNNAIYKYGASDKNYQHLRPNNLVMWEAIRLCLKNGCSSFSFGRTEPENSGLIQFKSGWGAKEDIIRYYKYDLKKGLFAIDSSNPAGLHNKILNKMPIPLLRITGSVLYKHIG